MLLSEFNPDWRSPPGRTIQEIMKCRRIDDVEASDRLGLTLEHFHALLSGVRCIDTETSRALAELFEMPAEFWHKREADFRRPHGAAAAISLADIDEKTLVKILPIRDMVSYGWIPPVKTLNEKLQACFEFFKVTSLAEWRQKHGGALAVAAFRSTEAFSENSAAVAAWLQAGENASRHIQCEDFDKDKLAALIPQFRRLTWTHRPEIFVGKLQQLCASAGVALVVARAPKGCRASGATKFLSDRKALLLLSFRHLTDDHFWFTFFHELGHLVLHGKNAIFLEDGSKVTEVEEREADEFAEHVILTPSQRLELVSLPISKVDIKRFAHRAGIAPGIIVGQLQHMQRIPFSQMNHLKRRYQW